MGNDYHLMQYLDDRLKQIEHCSDDNETAHWLEDEMHQFVLRKISEGEFGEASDWATKALETRKYDFRRWYA